MIVLEDNGKWLKGNFHMHTTLSDGRLDPKDAIRIYQEAGYDFITLTDHRKINREIRIGDFLVLSGAEWDVGDAGERPVYHILSIGMTGRFPDVYRFCRFEYGRQPYPQEIINAIREAGGEAILAHPAWSVMAAEEMMDLHGLAGAEIYNTVSGMPWNPDRADSSAYFDIWGKKGLMVSAYANDDAHYYEGDETRSFTMVGAESCTRDGILSAMRAGKIYASQEPRFHEIRFEEDRIVCTCDDTVKTVVFITNTPWGRRNVQEAETAGRGGTAMNVFYPGPTDTFCRIMLIDGQGRRAWSSPFSLL